MKELYNKKLRYFIIYTTIFGILFITSFLIGKYLKPEIPFGILYYWGSFCVFGSMGFGVIIPIILRLYFHNRALKYKKLTLSEYTKQQDTIVQVTFLGTLFILPALLFPVPMVHLYVTVLAGLYAIYSVLPSMKKIIGEINLYSIKL